MSERLDTFLASCYQQYTRSELQQYIKNGNILVDGEVVKKPSFLVSQDNSVIFNEPLKPDYSDELANFRQKCLIYQDNNVAVINKPSGLLVHAKGGIKHEFTVQDYVGSVFDPDELAANSAHNRLGIVHRLDRATSGVMITARNLLASRMLAKQFANRLVKKKYLAVVEKVPSQLEAQIDLPIGRNLAKPASFRVDPKGKSAITNYRVLKINSDGTALVELSPLTGRTHQLRVHLAYIGCPIKGDPVYGHKDNEGRLMLHALELEITIPGSPTNQRKVFWANPEESFQWEPNLQ